MVRVSPMEGSSPDNPMINLTRLLDRLEKTLLKSDVATERRLRSSSFERSKIATNIDYAKTLLLRLEQDALAIKVLSKRQDVQLKLLQKRDVIKELSAHLEDLEAHGSDLDDDESEGEDLLGEDTPSASDDVEGSNDNTPDQSIDDSRLLANRSNTEHHSSEFSLLVQHEPVQTEAQQREQLFPSELRARHAQAAERGQDTAETTSADRGITAKTEALLDHNRSEQESLTDSLLSMAQQLKASSQAFANSLESEKDVLGRATEGLDKNTSGLDAATKRMGYLRTMTEGRGWWGRMIMYAWIFGLMFVALFIVGFMPKLRFSPRL